jgi:hypothetical protein
MNKDTREFILYLVLTVLLIIELHLKTEINSTLQAISLLSSCIVLILCITKLFNNIKK